MNMAKITKECPFCGAEVKKENFNRHLLKAHKDVKKEKFEESGLSKPAEPVDKKKLEREEKIKAQIVKQKRNKRTLMAVIAIFVAVSVIAVVIYQGPKMFPGSGKSAPGAPINLYANAGNGVVNLAWSPPASDGGSPVTNYKIYRATSSGAETLINTIGNVLQYGDSAVSNGQTYYYEVSAMNQNGEGEKSGEKAAMPASSQTTLPVAVMTTTLGVIKIQLDTVRAPITAGNFVNLANSGFYNGVTFHRAEPGFVIQGGGYTSGGQLKSASKIPWENTGLKNLQWTISMARSGNANDAGSSGTATSQFFINLADNRGSLDTPTYPYVVFGKVIDGLNVVNAIAGLSTHDESGIKIIDNPPVINSVVIQY